MKFTAKREIERVLVMGLAAAVFFVIACSDNKNNTTGPTGPSDSSYVYIFDDSIMVGIAVITLSSRKMQQVEGRWLKLLSGAVVLLLGVMLIMFPGLLF